LAVVEGPEVAVERLELVLQPIAVNSGLACRYEAEHSVLQRVHCHLCPLGVFPADAFGLASHTETVSSRSFARLEHFAIPNAEILRQRDGLAVAALQRVR